MRMNLIQCSKLIDHKSPAVRAIIDPLLSEIDGLSKEEILMHVVTRFKEFRYVNYSGWKHFGEILRKREGNCLSLSCFLCSVLRALGFTIDEVFVGVIAKWRRSQTGFLPVTLPHAFGLIRLDPSIVCVNPNDMEPFKVNTERLRTHLHLGIEEYLPLFLFNDQRYRFLVLSFNNAKLIDAL